MKRLIVGLGNPGKKYDKTRHNIGFMLLDLLAESKKYNWKTSSKFDAKYVPLGDYALLKPQTYMNDSGRSVAKFVKYYDIKPDSILVIHDDLDLPFMKFKKQFGAGAAGHHGVESIIEQLKTKDFWRLRIGVGKPTIEGRDTIDWVLSPFSPGEIKSFDSEAEDLIKLLDLGA